MGIWRWLCRFNDPMGSTVNSRVDESIFLFTKPLNTDSCIDISCSIQPPASLVLPKPYSDVGRKNRTIRNPTSKYPFRFHELFRSQNIYFAPQIITSFPKNITSFSRMIISFHELLFHSSELFFWIRIRVGGCWGSVILAQP